MPHDAPIAAGSSSFDLVDLPRLTAALGLRPGMAVLDLACGRGAYALALAPQVLPGGRVHAVDLWEEGIAALRAEIARRSAGGVEPLLADAGRVPLPDASIDLCLMATVLHDLVQDGTDAGALREARRLVRPAGTLAVVEFRKIDGPPGPPRSIRLAPEEVEARVRQFGFAPRDGAGLGPFLYFASFARTAAPAPPP